MSGASLLHHHHLDCISIMTSRTAGSVLSSDERTFCLELTNRLLRDGARALQSCREWAAKVKAK